MSGQLTLENFVLRIKEMSGLERNCIPIEDLVNIIIQLPDNVGQSGQVAALENQVRSLTTTIEMVRQQVAQNSVEILNFKTKGEQNEKNVGAALIDINKLKHLNTNFYDQELKAFKRVDK